MSISTNIDGSIGGANQLITLLANAEEYQDRLKALQDAIALNKKYVELVAPASDIVALRDKLRDDKASLEIEVAKATADAKAAVIDAKAEAAEIVKDAKQEAKEIVAKAKAVEAAAKAKSLDIDSKVDAAEKAKARADALAAELESSIAKLGEAEQAQKDAKAELDKAKLDIISKHEAFIKSL